MKILIIGGEGTIGKHLVKHFSNKHELIVASRNNKDYTLDINSEDSIESFFKNNSDFNSVIVAAGEAKWAPFEEMSADDFAIGLNSKLMGQVNVVRIAAKYLKKDSSVTLTTGILADDPVYMTTSAAMVNGAIHSFVKAVNLEVDIRVNVVAPGLVEDAAEKYDGYFPGHIPVKMSDVVKYYEKSVEGRVRGEVLKIY